MAAFFDNAVRRSLLSYIPLWVHPNHLSVLRGLLLIPLILVRNNPEAAICVVFVSAMCDLFDGPLARVRGQVSQNGAVLDTMNDKVFNLGAIMLACRGRIHVVTVVVIVSLEVVLVLIRLIKKRYGIKADANAFGAIKVWLQTLGIGFVLSQWDFVDFASNLMFFSAIFFAVMSLIYHARDFAKRTNA